MCRHPVGRYLVHTIMVLQADGIVARETSCYYGARQQRGILVVRQGCYSRDLQPSPDFGIKGCLSAQQFLLFI